MSLVEEIPESESSRRKRIGLLADLLERQGIDVSEVGSIKRVNVWQGFYKDKAGVAHTVDQTGIVFSPTWEEGPEWPVVQRAAQAPVRASKSTPPKRDGGWQRAFVFPDAQVGVRRSLDLDAAEPMYDQRAIDTAFAVCKEAKPDLIINIGDLLDLAEISRYAKDPSFTRTVQPTLDYSHRFLARQRATVPNARIVVHEGNHDKRLPDYILTNAMAAFGIRRANLPDSWPVMSVPYLLRFDELGIEYIDGYPSDTFWVNSNLKTMHGEKVRSNSSTAAAVANSSMVSTIFGHVHRVEEHWVTHETERGPQEVMAASPGTLARVDRGAVPSFHSGLDSKGKAKGRPENWTQGCSVIDFHPDGRFHYQGIRIQDGVARWGPQDFYAEQMPDEG